MKQLKTQNQLIGQAPSFVKALNQAKKIALSSARVLIEGETGTGKEEIAKFLHNNSKRADKNFIAINCSAIPEALLESELFGHVKGAFTTAHKTHEGLISCAHEGTLFLDEIGDLEISLQAKLLRFLETGEFRKVGSNQVEYADVRILSATHRNLKNMVTHKTFREDLFYRLAVLSIKVPPLRNRIEDIEPLTNYFLDKLSKQENISAPQIENDAFNVLKNYSWPGNIRELQSLIQKTLVLNNSPIISVNDFENTLGVNTEGGNSNILSIAKKEPLIRPLWQVEKEAIEQAIEYCGGNITKAASLLEINPSTIYRKRIN